MMEEDTKELRRALEADFDLGRFVGLVSVCCEQTVHAQGRTHNVFCVALTEA